MSKKSYRALVVEDERAVQKLVMLALSQQGFTCDVAGDGKEAEKQLALDRYDAVVTDLQMPNKHGHALATELLALNDRPVIVVYTGVVEPRLAKDLLTRGVDDILFKPVDIGFLATKVKVLVERRSAAVGRQAAVGQQAAEAKPTASDLEDLQERASPGSPITLPSMERKLANTSRILPISSAALDVYSMANSHEWESAQIAAAIQRDATMAAEVLRLANSAFYNCSGQPIIQLERAVVLIGQKRIGELALATNALSALTSSMVPWMDTGLAWKQSMAAGLAIELLIEQGGHQEIQEGLLLSAIMHPLGRVISGTLYPGHYTKLVEECKQDGETLQHRERSVFPISHGEVIAHLLAGWNIPADVHLPLKLSLDDYAALSRVGEPARTRTELVKLAIFLGRIVVGQWEPWDLVDPCPAALVTRLGITSLPEIIEQSQRDLELLAKLRPAPAISSGQASKRGRELPYLDLTGCRFDFLAKMLLAMGITPLARLEDEPSDCGETLLVNCVGVSPDQLAERVGREPKQRLLIVTNAERVNDFRHYGDTVALPTSYHRLRSACWDASRPFTTAQQPLGSAVSQWA